MLAKHRINLHGGELLNRSEYLKERIDQMSPSLELIRSRLANRLDDGGSSSDTKRSLTEAVNGYLIQAFSDVNVYDATMNEELKS